MYQGPVDVLVKLTVEGAAHSVGLVLSKLGITP